MNIRPLTSTPKAFAFKGHEWVTKTTTVTTIHPLESEAEAKTLKNLGKLSPRQVVGVDLIPVPGWHTINFRTSTRNKIQTVSYVTANPQLIQVVYPGRKYKSMVVSKHRSVEAKPSILAHLNTLAEAFLRKRGRL